MAEYPEHEKQRAIIEQSQAIGEFLDIFLPSKGIVLAEYEGSRLFPAHQSITNLLAEFFDIDLKKIDEEKDRMLDKLREIQEADR